MKRKLGRRWISLACVLLVLLSMTGCSASQTSGKTEEESVSSQASSSQEATTSLEESKTGDTENASQGASTEPSEEIVEEQVKKNGAVVILFTSDIHCGIDEGFGLAGLAQIRANYEAQGYETILVDNGDAIQGETIGTLTKGEAIIDLMNELKYDVATPGNHEFDYGMDRFLELTQRANFPYVSCNFNKERELVFAPYVILEAAGKKIAFVGITTPKTITTSTPAYFQNEQGLFVYGFYQDEWGDMLFQGVQKAVNDARAEGAEYVYAMAHLGNESESIPWTYADVISHTSGIDVFLDGHSHDTDIVTMKNKDGRDVTRVAVGTKLQCIGYSFITADGRISKTGSWSWQNKDTSAVVFGFQNEIGDKVKETLKEYDALLDKVVAFTQVTMTIYDPEAVDENDNPIRIVRRMETNLGDLCADAIRSTTKADIAIINSGGIRKNLAQGSITYGAILGVFPYGNMISVIEVNGQQLLDALEWGARNTPGENGGFLQVAGMSYEINTAVKSGCKMDENGMFAGIEGKRRVQNVMIGGEALNPRKKYSLASINYLLKEHGDGFTMFDGSEIMQDRFKIDNQLLIEYITDVLGGVIGEEYADPYGQGRITILE